MALLDVVWYLGGGGMGCCLCLGFFSPGTNTSILIQNDGLTSVIVGSVLLWVTFDVGFWSQCRGKVLDILK